MRRNELVKSRRVMMRRRLNNSSKQQGEEEYICAGLASRISVFTVLPRKTKLQTASSRLHSSVFV
jgi:hypothetical protein